MFNLEEEMKRLKKKYPCNDPNDVYGSLEQRKKEEVDLGLPRFGTVVDNRDPQCLGRVRVAADTIAPGAITPWIPVIALGAGKGFGWWQIPDIGSQVLMAFVGKGHSNPVVLGNIYDLKNRPPKPSTKNPADGKLYQTKNHRMEFIDEGGRESLIISTAKGKMRLVLDKRKGIELINELGDIKIRCRKLKISGDKGIDIAGEKKVSIKSEDKGKIKASKGIKVENDKEVKIKGQCVKFESSRGITTEGKQLAAEGDKVMGFDVHQMVVPAGTSTAVVPLPHPFIGKLADKLSENVKIKGHNAALKGSIAKHDDTMHNQLPGTIRFNQNPRKEGEVTGGTGRKLKINGKEPAVIGSTVTTCNDVGARENSVILAVGASIPMPVIINPKNMDKWKEERESENGRESEFTDARWVKSRVREGELVELSARVKDIEDGNMVTFQIWREGQDPNAQESYYRLPATVEGGATKAEWKSPPPENEEIPEEDPVYYFTVHSAWCPPKRSDMLTVELRRPEIRKCEWQDKDGSGTAKNVLGEPVRLVAETKDIEDGQTVTFRIYPEGADTKKDKPIKTLDATVMGDKAEVSFNFEEIQPKPIIDEALYRYYKEQGYDIPREDFEFFLDDYNKDIKSNIKTKPKCFYTANTWKCKEASSESLEVSKTLKITYFNAFGQPVKDVKIKVKESDGTEHKGTTNDEGIAEFADLIPANNYFSYERDESKKKGV